MKEKVEFHLAKKNIASLDFKPLKDFFQKNLHRDLSTYSRADYDHHKSSQECYNAIMGMRSVSSFKINIQIPYKEMYEEARKLKSQFVDHRKDPNWGWRAICLHGTQADHTNDYYVYGFKDRTEANYNWTEISKSCPVTTKWLRETWPYDNYLRVRFVLLEPGGAIVPHNDTDGERGFFAVNVALNQPFGCLMAMDDYGIIPWAAGDVRLMDIGLRHAVVNLSKQDRYHMIIHGHADNTFEDYKNLVINSL